MESRANFGDTMNVSVILLRMLHWGQPTPPPMTDDIAYHHGEQYQSEI